MTQRSFILRWVLSVWLLLSFTLPSFAHMTGLGLPAQQLLGSQSSVSSSSSAAYAGTLVGGGGGEWVEVCSTDGFTWVKVNGVNANTDLGQAAQHDKHPSEHHGSTESPLGHCPFCHIQSGLVASFSIQATTTPWQVTLAGHSQPESPSLIRSLGIHAYAQPPARAPPFVS